MKVVDEIKKIFEERITSLNNEKKENLKKITEWSTKQKKEIDEHVTTQKQRLEQDFVNQKTTVEDTRRQYVEKASADAVKKNKELAAELVDECRQLQFKLDDLRYYSQEIQYISVGNIGASVTEQHRHECSAEESGKQTPRGGSANNRQTNATSADGQPENRIRRSSMTQTSPQLSHSTSAINATRTRNEDDSEADNRCPVCFMIFSQNMSRDDREQHVNDHYADD